MLNQTACEIFLAVHKRDDIHLLYGTTVKEDSAMFYQIHANKESPNEKPLLDCCSHWLSHWVQPLDLQDNDSIYLRESFLFDLELLHMPVAHAVVGVLEILAFTALSKASIAVLDLPPLWHFWTLPVTCNFW